MIVAQSNLFTFEYDIWSEYPICLFLPEKDSSADDTYFCIIEIGNKEPKKIYSVDSLQSVILAVGYLKNRMKALKDDGLHLYFCKNHESSIDIDLVLRNDPSFYWNNGILFESGNKK
jgi:hypothetical protein